MTQNGTLSTNQRRALAALLAEPTIRAAARTASLGERTLYRYLSDPVFKAELSARQTAILAQVTAAMVGLSGRAVETLRDVLDDKEATASVKVRAALGWLQQARQGVELQDLAERVTELERRLEGQK
jgi:hypothetical protein